jgi:regulator of replication initiation timing
MLHKFLFFSFLLIVCSFSYGQDYFGEWDLNKDGKITKQEFPGDASYFSLIDTNNNGIIDRKEFNRFVGLPDPVEEAPVLPPTTLPNNGQLEAKIKDLEKQIATYKLQVQQLTNEKNALSTENQTLKLEKMKFQKDMTQLANLQNEVARLNNEVAQLKKQGTPVIVTPTENADSVAQSVAKPQTTPAQDMLMAEESARLDAMRALAEKIKGSWIAACSQSINGTNQVKVIGQLNPTKLIGVQQIGATDYDFVNSALSVTMEISRAFIVESIRQNNPQMSLEEYQEIRFMFPEKLTATGRGAWSQQGINRVMALYGAQLDARRKLVEQLRGFIVKSSSRMENFVMQEHKVVMSIETTLLIGVNLVKEEIIQNAIAQSTISIDRPMFIYSIRKGLNAEGLEMTPEEYQNLRSMLKDEKYTCVGKAAVAK